jgi:hypothetical protein
MVRKMIFVKDWSMLLHGLKRWYAALKSPLRTMFRGFDSVRIFSSPNIELESSLSYKLRLFKKAVILFLFPTERKHFPKVF